MRSMAKIRGIEFQVTIEDVWEQFVRQDKRCRYSGVSIGFLDDAPNWKGTPTNTASLDRIDSSKGYVKDNICWSHKTINVMKLDLTQAEFERWAKLVAGHATQRETIPVGVTD